MKKSCLIVAIFIFVVSACASPTQIPTTPTVGVTPSAIPSPTITKTATPSVPMIEVGGLQVPDPKVSNPELFDIF